MLEVTAVHMTHDASKLNYCELHLYFSRIETYM